MVVASRSSMISSWASGEMPPYLAWRTRHSRPYLHRDGVGRQETLHLQFDHWKNAHPRMLRRQPLSRGQEVLLEQEWRRLHHDLRLISTGWKCGLDFKKIAMVWTEWAVALLSLFYDVNFTFTCLN